MPEKKSKGRKVPPKPEKANVGEQEQDVEEILKKLSILKMKLVTATDFHDVFNYFFDHFGENDKFMSIGYQERHPLLEQVLVNTARQVLKTSVVVLRNGFFIHVPGQQFIHGACLFNEHLGNFFYFEEIDTGMIAIVLPHGKGSITQVGRFSLKKVDDAPEHSVN